MQDDNVLILLAAYNGGQYITEQIDSILNQTHRNLTLWASDDASSDDTLEIIRHYEQSDGRVKSFCRLKSSGSAQAHFFSLLEKVKASLTASDSRSNAEPVHGIASLIARGSRSNAEPVNGIASLIASESCSEAEPAHVYIMFSDQDDVWLADKIEKTLVKMKAAEREHGVGTPLLVHTDLFVGLQDGAPRLFDFQKLDRSATSLNRLLVQNNVTGCTVMFNRALLDKVVIPCREQKAKENDAPSLLKLRQSSIMSGSKSEAEPAHGIGGGGTPPVNGTASLIASESRSEAEPVNGIASLIASESHSNAEPVHGIGGGGTPPAHGTASLIARGCCSEAEPVHGIASESRSEAEPVNGIHDHYMGVCAAALGRVVFLDEATILYRQHGANVLGAVKGGVLSTVKRLFVKVFITREKKLDLETGLFVGQARFVYENHKTLLREESRVILERYLELPSAGFFGRRARYFKYGFWRQNFFQKVLQFLFC